MKERKRKRERGTEREREGEERERNKFIRIFNLNFSRFLIAEITRTYDLVITYKSPNRIIQVMESCMKYRPFINNTFISRDLCV